MEQNYTTTSEVTLATRAFSVLMRDLPGICDAAFAHAITRMEDYHPLTASDQRRRHFYRLCAEGQKMAQARLLERILEVESMRTYFTQRRKEASRNHDNPLRREISEALQAIKYSEMVYRMIANAIAWTLLGDRPWEMRRYYLEQQPVALSSSNLGSLIRIANRINDCPDKLAFLTDLTSCIQVGDLILVDHSATPATVQIAEVKEGDKSKEMIAMLSSCLRSGRTQEMTRHLARHDRKYFDQFSRTWRQMDRMNKVTEIIRTDHGVDPVSGKEVHIVDSDVCQTEYDEVLNEVLDEAAAQASSMRCIEGCIWVGAFDCRQVPHGREQFESHISTISGHTLNGRRLQCHTTQLSNAVELPQIRPIVLRAIKRDHLLDILLGFLQVYLYLDFNRLFTELAKRDVHVRWQTKRERREHFQDDYFSTLGKAPVVDVDGSPSVTIGDIAIARLLYEGWTVDSLADWYKAMCGYKRIITIST